MHSSSSSTASRLPSGSSLSSSSSSTTSSTMPRRWCSWHRWFGTSTNAPSHSTPASRATTYITRIAIVIIVYLLYFADNPTTVFIRQRKINNRQTHDNPYSNGRTIMNNNQELSNEIQKIIRSRFIPNVGSSSSSSLTRTTTTSTSTLNIPNNPSTVHPDSHPQSSSSSSSSSFTTTDKSTPNKYTKTPLVSSLSTYYIPYSGLQSTLFEQFMYNDELPTALTEEQIYRIIPDLYTASTATTENTEEGEEGSTTRPLPRKRNKKPKIHPASSSPQALNILVFGVGEMLGSSIVRMCLHHPNLCNVILGIEDFSTGFVTVVPSGISFIEIPYNEKGMKRLFSTLETMRIPLASIDAIIWGFDNVLNRYVNDAIDSFLKEMDYQIEQELLSTTVTASADTIPTTTTNPLSLVRKPPVFILPDTFSRPYGIQSEPMLYGAKDDHSPDTSLFQTIYQRWYDFRNPNTHQRKNVNRHRNEDTVTNTTAYPDTAMNDYVLEDFTCSSPPSTSSSESSSLSLICQPEKIQYNERSFPDSARLPVPHRNAIIGLMNIGNNPAIGPGIQKINYNQRKLPSMKNLFNHHNNNNNVYNGPLYALTECLDNYALKTTDPAYHRYELLPLLESFERSLKANPSSTEPDETSPEYFLHSCEGAFLNALDTLPMDVDAVALGILGATVNLVYNTDIESKVNDLPETTPWYELPLLAFHVSVRKDSTTSNDGSNTGRKLSSSSGSLPSFSLLYSSSLPSLAVEASGPDGYLYYKKEHLYYPLDIVPAPLWSLPKAFKLKELSPESIPVINRLAKFADTVIDSLNSPDSNRGTTTTPATAVSSQDTIKSILLHLIETSWWIFRHGALSGYREPFPSDDDFGGIDYSRLTGKEPKISTSTDSLNMYGKLQLLRGDKYGNAFAYGNKYTLRDIYYFGITHHTIHHKAAASSASYCWRLRRGGVKWYSTTFDPVLPVLAIDHPAGQHYGTLFLRVAMVWEHVHVATSLSYPWYVRIWDDNYIISEGYVATANLFDSTATIALGRVGEHADRKGRAYLFTGGGACALLSNALVRVQARIMPSCREAAEHWYYHRSPSTPGFDPSMPECAPGRFGCEDVVISYCLRKELGSKYVIVKRPGFNHVDAETLNEKGMFECRGLACRRRVKAEDNEGKAELTVVLHWVKSGEAMVKYDNALYGKEISDDKRYCLAESIEQKCFEEFSL